MNRSVLSSLSAMVALLLAVGCGEGEEEGVNQDPVNQDQGQGPCVVEYREPIVLITAVVEAGNSDAIAEVEISEIALHGGSVQQLGMTEDLIEGESGVFACAVPCGFGFQPGEYTFTVGAEGYEAREVTVDAEYETFVGGCPASYDGGTEVEVELTRAAPDPE